MRVLCGKVQVLITTLRIRGLNCMNIHKRNVVSAESDLFSIKDMEGNVTIVIRQGDKVLYFNSVIVSVGEKSVDIEPIDYQGKILSFTTSGYSMKIECIKNSRHLELKVSSITLVRKEDGTMVHRIVSFDSARPKNLRKYKRFSLGDAGVLQLGDHHRTIQCIIHDISYGGVGLGIKGTIDIPLKEFLNLSFIHKQNMTSTTVRAKCIAVRTNYNDESDETLIGLKLLSDNAGVTKVVNDVQRAELQKITHDRRLRIE